MKISAHLQRSGFIVLALTLHIVSSRAQVPFTEVLDSGDLGVAISRSQGASWGDYDGDGDLDLVVCTFLQSANPVFRNDGGGHFSRMTAAEIGDLGEDVSDAVMALWADIDNDGDLDLYIANYSEAIVPEDYWRFENPVSAQEDRLYLNDGAGRFVRTEMPGLSEVLLYSFGASLADFDADGLLDVFVTTVPILAGWSGPDHLFRNDGILTFSTVSLPGLPTVGYSSSWWDYDQDGDLDALVNNWRESDKPVIFENLAGEEQDTPFAVSSAFANGESLRDRASHSAVGDYDNDGDLDLYIQSGSLSDAGGGNPDLWTNQGEGAFVRRSFHPNPDVGSDAAVWFDYDNDGNLDLLVHSYYRSGTDVVDDGFFLYKGDGQGGFSEYLLAAPRGQFQFGGVVGDFDNDGFLDILIPASTEDFAPAPDRLYRNNGNSNHWLKLVLSGTDSNGSAIGAIVRVRAVMGGRELWQMRQIMAGDGQPYVQRDMRPNFGLGDATVAEVVRIEWPSGTVQELTGVAADQILTLVEPPRLKVESGGQLSWPVTADGYRLESATSIDGTWSEASETVQIDGSRKRVTIQPDGETKFFRLNGQ